MQPAKNCWESGSNSSLNQLKDLKIKSCPVSSEHQTPNSEWVVSSPLLGVQIQLIQTHSRCSALAGEEGGTIAAALQVCCWADLERFMKQCIPSPCSDQVAGWRLVKLCQIVILCLLSAGTKRVKCNLHGTHLICTEPRPGTACASSHSQCLKGLSYPQHTVYHSQWNSNPAPPRARMRPGWRSWPKKRKFGLCKIVLSF